MLTLFGFDYTMNLIDKYLGKIDLEVLKAFKVLVPI